jgi:hypothetical protein
MVLTGFFGKPTTTSSTATGIRTSDLSTTATLIILFFAIGTMCGFGLFKRYRPHRVDEPVSPQGLELDD